MMEVGTMEFSFIELPDLASTRVGGRVLWANDDFFASKGNLLRVEEPVFIPGKYTTRGKWMDGWETRRRRSPGYDWCLIQLGMRGVLRGVVVDTRHFTGNYAESCSIEAVDLPGRPKPGILAKKEWTEILNQTRLQGDSRNLFEIHNPKPWTHLKFKIYPDGGVARLRAHGEVAVDWPRIIKTGKPLDLAVIENGGVVLAVNDSHFGRKENLIMPGRSISMADGWETRRRRGPGHDWAIIRLGAPGTIEKVEVDTNYFKGNYPDRCSIEGVHWPGAVVEELSFSRRWVTILEEAKLGPHRRHFFAKEIKNRGPFTHLRLNIYPDGGVSRLRLIGRPVQGPIASASSPWERLNTMAEPNAVKKFLRCCASTKWAEAMARRRPFLGAAALTATADDIWKALSRQDWLEAFRGHPKIGDKDSLRRNFPATAKWAGGEQGGVAAASDDVISALAQGNKEYEKKFGYIFIVCATGKSAADMLSILRDRLANSPEVEIEAAAHEQSKIIKIRLEKFFDELR